MRLRFWQFQIYSNSYYKVKDILTGTRGAAQNAVLLEWQRSSAYAEKEKGQVQDLPLHFDHDKMLDYGIKYPINAQPTSLTDITKLRRRA